MDLLFCGGALVVHAAGEMTCTEPECDIGWPDVHRHLIGPVRCSICYPCLDAIGAPSSIGHSA